MLVITWILFALSIAVIVGFLDKKHENGGFIGAGLLTVSGTLLSLFFSHLFFGTQTSFDISTSLIAMYGSLVLLLVGRGVRKLW